MISFSQHLCHRRQCLCQYDQSQPVDAWRNPNTGRLEVQDGHHRTEAAKKAGLDKIPVQVWE
ncbi:hypothetical protein FN961_25470 [Shewanella hanedai]|uniref:Uncharacterized protein n=1 Tax=Shewanella hanedai TaxID=25 RepID=A0A553JCL2_SHEHA|nr:hypothetical protein FN961_25470 [Shewanella hanedai]